jgi:antitoxin VapB
MTEPSTAKLFKNGRSQAVRLPKEFRFRGDQVRIRRSGKGILLEPYFDLKSWFVELDKLSHEELLPDGRRQPAAPPRKVFD